MIKLITLLFFFIVTLSESFATCSSPISRTNNSANTVLTSTKYNTDLNTVYTKVNDLDGDCISDSSIATAKIEDNAVTEAKIAAAVLAKLVPTGAVLAYAGTTAPDGFLLCDGTQVSRTTYSALYAVIGDAHGNGNGTTTFHLPDYKGRFLRGRANGSTRDPDRASRTAMATGGNTGDNVGSVQADEYEGHFHTDGLGLAIATALRYGATTGLASGTYQSEYGDNNATGTYTNGAKTSTEGGNETRPENANVNFIIKY